MSFRRLSLLIFIVLLGLFCSYQPDTEWVSVAHAQTPPADTTAPVLVTTAYTFSADSAKSLTLSFVDFESGIKSVTARITQIGGNALVAPTGSSLVTTSNTGTYTFTYNFSEAKFYQLEYTVCNNIDLCKTRTGDLDAANAATLPTCTVSDPASGLVSQCILGGVYEGIFDPTLVNFFTVVATVPSFDSTSCAGTNYAVTCPSTVTFSTGTKVADNSEYHSVMLQLSDKFGNRVVSEAGIKQVKTRFNFNNTTKLDQVALTGDAVRFFAGEFTLDKNPAGTTTDWLIESAGATPFASSVDGKYTVQVFAYAPTSTGYTPITASGFNIQLASIDYEVTDLGCRESVGETAEGGVCPVVPPSCTIKLNDQSAGLVNVCTVQ